MLCVGVRHRCGPTLRVGRCARSSGARPPRPHHATPHATTHPAHHAHGARSRPASCSSTTTSSRPRPGQPRLNEHDTPVTWSLAVASSLPALLTPSHSPQGQGGECFRTRSPARAGSNLWASPLATPRVRARGPSGRHPSQPLPGRPGLTTPASTTGSRRGSRSGGPPPKVWLARPLGPTPYHGLCQRVGALWVGLHRLREVGPGPPGPGRHRPRHPTRHQAPGTTAKTLGLFPSLARPCAPREVPPGRHSTSVSLGCVGSQRPLPPPTH